MLGFEIGDVSGRSRRFYLRNEKRIVGPVDRELLSEEGLNGAQTGDVTFARESDRVTRGAGPRGSADPVDVILGVERDVVVVDVRDTVDVEPACRDVGGDENGKSAVFEIREHFDPLVLRNVPRKLCPDETIGAEPADDGLGGDLRVDEDEDPGSRVPLQEAEQQTEFFVTANVIKPLFDAVRRFLLGSDLYLLREVHVLVSQLHDAVRQRR